jgi:hypothetical protein
MIAAALCREMKWTWQEYLDQPLPFLWAITAMLKAESDAAKRKNAA